MSKNVVKRDSTIKGDTDHVVPLPPLPVDLEAGGADSSGSSDVGNLNPVAQARNSANREAKVIINEATQHREKILSDLEAELEQRRQAHNLQLAASTDKHEKEIAKRRDVLERELRGELENEFRTRYEQAIKSLEKAASNLSVERDAYLKQIEEPAMKLVLEVSRQMIGRELMSDGKIMGDLIIRAFEMLKPDEAVSVHVHPASFHLLLENESFNSDLAKAGFSPKFVELEIDENLAPDQFRAELSGMKVEFNLQESVNEIIEVLTKELNDRDTRAALSDGE